MMTIENIIDTTEITPPPNPTKQKRPYLRHSEWLVHINHCHESNMRHEDYCAEHNLSIQSFKKQLWEQRRKTRIALPDNNHFVPVTVCDDRQTIESAIEIRFAHGVVLKIPHTTSLSTAIKLLQRQV
jgi:hypothetical protein